MTANYVLLERIELNASAASVTFNNLNTLTGYTDLKIVVSARDTSTAGGNWNGYSFTIYPNGLSTNISQRSLFGNGSGAASYTDTQMYNVIDMSADTANTFSNVEIYIPNYTSSNAKSFSIDGVAETNATASAIRISAGLWNSSAAITSLQLNAYSTFVSGSTFTLYGIAKLGTTPAIAPKADGGNVIATDGTYWYHAFLSNGTFTPQTGLSADVLVVAGGGGGGSNGGGGGGAGGVIVQSSTALSVQNYTCTVGAGGAAGTNGTNTVFGSNTAIGGGKGGPFNQAGSSGGSGGGGAMSAGASVIGGSGTSGQGYAGGTGSSAYSSSTGGGGGGGGAGAVGTNATNANPMLGAGGVGVSGATYSFINGMGAATGFGQLSGGNYYFAGGGSGGPSGHSVSNYGGLGGGANFNASATAFTGGGGGGGQAYGTDSPGAGGSGIIIIRYPVAS